jgi:hypothetical protein
MIPDAALARIPETQVGTRGDLESGVLADLLARILELHNVHTIVEPPVSNPNIHFIPEEDPTWQAWAA